MTTEGRGNIVIPCYLDANGRPFALEINSDGYPKVEVYTKGGDKPLSFESTVQDYQTDASLSAGAAELRSGLVPTGKLWVITTVSWEYVGTPPARMLLQLNNGSSNYTLAEWTGITSGLNYQYTGQLYIPASGYLRLYMLSATLNDDASLSMTGYQVDAL